MAKKVTGQVKLQIPAGKATPAPPVGTALGPQGVNIMEFCKAFNAKTSRQGPGRPDHPGGDHDLLGPLLHVHHQDPAGAGADQARRAIWPRARAEPNKNKVGKITMAQVEEIAKIKMPDLNCFTSSRPSTTSRALACPWAWTSRAEVLSFDVERGRPLR